MHVYMCKCKYACIYLCLDNVSQELCDSLWSVTAEGPQFPLVLLSIILDPPQAPLLFFQALRWEIGGSDTA